MKQRLIALILILVLAAPGALFAQAAEQEERSAAASFNQGVFDAEDDHSALGWGVGGFFAGGLFSWLGTGVVVLIANGSNPSPDYMPEDVEPISYRRGYRDEARRKNRRAAAIPGVIMSTLWTIAVLSAAQ